MRTQIARRLRRLPDAVRDAWPTGRPTTRRGALRAAAIILGLGAGLSVVFFLGAAAVSSFTNEYGFHPVANANAWRELTPAYGDISLCVRCHTLEQRRLASATHAGIGCESCHGPLGSHAFASPGSAEAAVAVAVPTDEVCVKCHVKAVGRPTSFRQIVPADHYISACLQCHDPHTAIARRPPVVQHTLSTLPVCVTCHGPEGFKARNQRHPTTATSDKVCLSCHLAGRGPDENESDSE